MRVNVTVVNSLIFSKVQSDRRQSTEVIRCAQFLRWGRACTEFLLPENNNNLIKRFGLSLVALPIAYQIII